MSFNQLSLNSTLITRTQELGYDQATPIQLAAIPPILAGSDVMAGAQTGTGKTAAFALPILNQLLEQKTNGQPKALVLTPTRELAQQVHQSFKRYAKGSGLITVCIYGGVSLKPQIEQLKQGVDIIIATPGRALDHLHKGSFKANQIQTLVFDEADRMLDLGFSDEINRILKRIPKTRQTLLFSATFDDRIFKLSRSLLNDPKLIEVSQRNTAAEQVEQLVYAVDKARKREMLSHIIGARNYQQVLIFARTKQGVDSLVKQMNLDGIKTEAIHGDKSQGTRDKALAEFKQGNIRALVATDVASRGIDIRELKYVFNYELPFNSEDYIHRIGRTGRAGEKGLAISLLSADEHYLLEPIEKLLDQKLTAQWLPGYEPDLSKLEQPGRPKDKAKAKRKKLRGRRR